MGERSCIRTRKNIVTVHRVVELVEIPKNKLQITNKSQHAAQAPALRVTEIQNPKHVHDLQEQTFHLFGSLDIGI